MRAFYLVNPQSFENGNINKIISGSDLIVPTESLIAEVPRQKAINFVYAVSKDQSSATSKQVSQAQSGIPPLELNRPALIKPLNPELIADDDSTAKPTNQAVKPSSNNMQQDLESWRSVAEEFSSLSAIVESQNKAVKNQNTALKTLSSELDNHEQKILELSLRINSLESLQHNVGEQNSQRTPAANRVIADQTAVIDIQKTRIETFNRQLQDKDQKLAGLQNQLKSLNETTVTVAPPPLPDKKQSPQPEAISDTDASKIITHTQQDLPVSPTIWIILTLLGIALIFAARKWFWRRRLNSVQPAAKKIEKVNPAREKSSNYHPDKDSGGIELKDLNIAQKNPQDTVLDQPDLKLESSSINEIKIEIDVLLAYEQYSDAMNLVQSSRERFGEDAWLDIKELEILASSRQCDKFFAQFNIKKSKLEHELPRPWGKIEKLRKQLCKEFKISAVQ